MLVIIGGSLRQDKAVHMLVVIGGSLVNARTAFAVSYSNVSHKQRGSANWCIIAAAGTEWAPSLL